MPRALAWVAAAVFRPVANWSSVATTSVALPLGCAMAAAYASTASAGETGRPFFSAVSSSGAPASCSPSAGSSAPPNIGTLEAMRNGWSGLSETMTCSHWVLVASSSVEARMARGHWRPCDWATIVGFGRGSELGGRGLGSGAGGLRRSATRRASPVSTSARAALAAFASPSTGASLAASSRAATAVAPSASSGAAAVCSAGAGCSPTRASWVPQPVSTSAPSRAVEATRRLKVLGVGTGRGVIG